MQPTKSINRNTRNRRTAGVPALRKAAGLKSDAMFPLCVDLDGTLIHTDLLHENFVSAIAAKPWLVFSLLFWLARGRAYLKARLAGHVVLDPALLPYDERVLDYLRREKAKGRRLILATASIRSQADAVADHLGLFDAVLASEPDRNLKGAAKAALLGGRFKQFSYLGNDRSDMVVWRGAQTAGIANASTRLGRRIADEHVVEVVIPRRRGLALAVIKALRPYQWV